MILFVILLCIRNNSAYLLNC